MCMRDVSHVGEDVESGTYMHLSRCECPLILSMLRFIRNTLGNFIFRPLSRDSDSFIVVDFLHAGGVSVLSRNSIEEKRRNRSDSDYSSPS